MVEYNVNLEGKTVLVTGAAGFITRVRDKDCVKK